MKILVLGRSGQVARALSELSTQTPQADFVFMGRDSCDLADSAALERAIQTNKPDAIINAAAYTAVDAAQNDEVNARAINALGPALAAKLAARDAIPFVHLSTDYVFDGTKNGPYVETDETNPINVYGVTKRDGEVLILEQNPDAVILRTSWVYSPFGKNFVRTMLTLAQSKDQLSIVDDQHGAPTAAQDIAKACLEITHAKLAGNDAAGIFHMTGGGETTWRGFGEAIFAASALWRGGKSPIVIGVPTSAYPTPARRPSNSRLNCDLLDKEFGVRLPHWQVSLTQTLAVLHTEFGGHHE